MVALAEKIDWMTLDAVCRKHHVRKLSVFGSFARGDERPDSDVDVLLEFDPEFRPTLLDLAGFADDLKPVFGGRKIDVARPSQLHWFIRDQVLKETREIYAR